MWASVVTLSAYALLELDSKKCMFCRSMDPLVSEALHAEVTADGAHETTSSPVASPLDGGMLHPADDQVHCCNWFG